MNFNNKQLAKAEMEEVGKDSRSMNEDLFDFTPFAKKSVKHFRQIVPVQIHHFYITDVIKDVDAYINMINTLKTSEQHDTIFIYLNTPGGDLLTTLQIMAAIKQSAATVVTCIEGQAASAGTMIFLAGHRHMVSPNSIFMAHNYSGGNYGKGNELKTRQKFDEIYFYKLVKDIYSGFLTDDELNGLMEDRDVWLDADEVSRRVAHKLIRTDQSQDDAQNLLAALLGEGGSLNIPIAVSTEAPKPKRKKAPLNKKAKPKSKVAKPTAK